MATETGIDPAASPLPRIVLVGNPNVGKSVFFRLLTGRYVIVSNYPGTTVEVARGVRRAGGTETEVIDVPGANSFSPNSEDERVARDVVLSPGEKTVLQVADAKNLRRSLLLSIQLAEFELPMALALNMWDEAQDRGIEYDLPALQELLGVEAIPTVATERRGIARLPGAIRDARPCRLRVDYGKPIEDAVAQVERLLPPAMSGRRGLALMLLAGDPALESTLRPAAPDLHDAFHAVRRHLAAALPRPIALAIQHRRAVLAEQVLHSVTRPGRTPSRRGKLSTLLGHATTHPVGGTIFLLVVLALIYFVVGVFGAGTCVDFLEETVFGVFSDRTGDYGGLVNGPLSNALASATGKDNIVYSFFFDDTSGIFSTGLTYAFAIVFPIVTLFFLLFSLMEDSGYLPRLSLLADRLLKRVGLSGKAVLPLVIGLGCGTMATMTTRILETRRQRFIAILLLALAVPCSAQLGVITGILSSISITGIALYLGFLLFAFFATGWAASRILPGESPDLFLEVPPFRLPRLGNVVAKTYYRVKWFMREAVPLFLLGTVCLFIAEKTGLLHLVEQAARPVVSGVLGLPPETAIGFILGFLRRDYGTVIVFEQFRTGVISANDVLVALIVITLFVPCLAHFFICIKELGLKKALVLDAIVLLIAIAVGAVVRVLLALTGISVG